MKTLIIASHPYFENSKANKFLLNAAKEVPDVKIRHLEDIYGTNTRNFDVALEHSLIEEADRIVLQFPMFWFSVPPLLKAYIDEIFTHGWAYGSDGNALVGKELQIVVSTGSSIDKYSREGSIKHSVEEILLPLNLTANYCGMVFNKVFIVDDVLSNIDSEKFGFLAQKYIKLLKNEIDEEEE
ncbi:NAD(P)H-dependent oxidoreductase [Campylobacter sp. RM9344]|uniref:NAD(P)H-dependent oxidoreductase n=1 Tax=Campylobacter californiensis TaxID=1032243 RepID=A0AAW3ZXR0_9BACT|nr:MULTISPECIES: NAD(P)H-dependent oxidoreductase [unclassified Campylobacter]MBE2984060.1 NAD(P)H-dependent oxidoreductase [Campylobacter sp. RM6883]MBE2987114.1 NAD(P)H-dependent oxidoreductase [Campylobacter sp. RM12919]MBE2988381.1 NAD(P)H-dependent oxidoreductase [Campylobacter sp. RM12920]MBE2995485.1 NAD(P)H-dependent oxidoreductase [Campylobacter sp. RM6913]MBE3021969.1 NAD(P)H-dependent oxidoreductase [Campylobacter sp. 7477a]MBE3029829.1 NAD(P)H-dependent oxidoreductase [Campylobact